MDRKKYRANTWKCHCFPQCCIFLLKRSEFVMKGTEFWYFKYSYVDFSLAIPSMFKVMYTHTKSGNLFDQNFGCLHKQTHTKCMKQKFCHIYKYLLGSIREKNESLFFFRISMDYFETKHTHTKRKVRNWNWKRVIRHEKNSLWWNKYRYNVMYVKRKWPAEK